MKWARSVLDMNSGNTQDLSEPAEQRWSWSLRESEELFLCVCVCMCVGRIGGVWSVKCHKCDDGGVGKCALA